jgi:hypothetical protein
MNIAGLDLATTSGLTALKNAGTKDGVYEATTFKASVKKKPLEKDDDKGLDAMREGEIARKFADFLEVWLIENQIGYVAIEAPLPSNPTRKKRTIDRSSEWAGQAIRYEEVAGTSFAAIFRIYGLEMIAVMICNRLNIPVLFLAQGKWRRDFLGNGRPQNPKKEAKKACERLGITVSSLDAAESVGVCWCLNQILNPYSGRPNDLFGAGAPASKAKENARARAEQLFKNGSQSEASA